MPQPICEPLPTDPSAPLKCGAKFVRGVPGSFTNRSTVVVRFKNGTTISSSDETNLSEALGPYGEAICEHLAAMADRHRIQCACIATRAITLEVACSGYRLPAQDALMDVIRRGFVSR